MTDCEQGFHCRENAQLLEETDKKIAATLYAKACAHDADACRRASVLSR